MIAKDPVLTTATCLYRRVLSNLFKVESSSLSIVQVLGPMGLPDQDANKFTKKLIQGGVLADNHPEDGHYNLCKIQLQAGLKKFLGVKSQEKATLKSIVSGTEDMDLDERGDAKTGVKRSKESSEQENMQGR